MGRGSIPSQKTLNFYNNIRVQVVEMLRPIIKWMVPLLLLGVVYGYPAEDEVTDLPGLGFPINFAHYSGYLNGTEGIHLHYWFTESSRPEETPLILWLNGGPGCSSLDGLLSENGPFHLNDDGTALWENPYAWNTVGNVIYLESPACVGFSYHENGTCVVSDDQVAEQNYKALQHFFTKFPEYRDREFYITGESYAGVYIPTLSVKIVEGNDTFPINFAGFAIGNGLLSYENNDNSMMFFGRYHALLGEELWDEMVERCCEGGVEDRSTCNFHDNYTAQCEVSVLKAIKILEYDGLNIYNIYKPTAIYDPPETTRAIIDRMNTYFYTKRKHNIGQTLDNSDSAERAYLNDPDVRSALHIPSFVQDWDVCSDPVFNTYIREVEYSDPYLKTLHDNNVRGLLYNGDVDMACNFLGNTWDIEELQYEVTDSRSMWYVNGQIAGYVEKFELLDFVTIRGSGHMVPTDKPPEALHMIDAFINKNPY